ncbi:MAG TPA: hypothetical protein DCE41_02330 [Cytophagales bacterium]|nr:hypothetical protein [Cytophagales bacterium]HAA23723.1 hypothetical protein [Cytophagales bacterium]HAP61243.1 hypothetical protein [Cytophagales bacterium]
MNQRCFFIILLLLGMIGSVRVFADAYPAKGALEFISNKGQWPAAALFRSHLPDGGSLWVQSNGYKLALRHPEDSQWIRDQHLQGEKEGNHHPRHRSIGPTDRQIRYEAIDVHFLGGSAIGWEQEELLNYPHHYFLGNDQDQWATDVPLSQRVRMSEVYPGIDFIFSSDDVLPKYDWVLAPGADPHAIRMKFTGARSLEVVENRLVVQTQYQQWVEETPWAYQKVNGVQKEVPCHFVLDGDIVTFSFPYGYDPTLPLTIDPVLVFSTYSGSTADNWGYTACFDDSGNLYSGGIVFTSGFPTTPGAFQESWSGAIDIGIHCYDSLGTGLLYATYLGGAGPELPQSLLVAPDNSLLILGITSSNDFPITVGAYDPIFHGGPYTEAGVAIDFPNGIDLVVSRLSQGGDALIGATYLGGTGNDGHKVDSSDLHFFYGDDFRGDIIADQEGNLYLASVTQSNDFPTTAGAYQESLGGQTDAVLVSLLPDLTALRFSTYLGGTEDDAATSIKLSESGDVLLGGGTTSADFTGVMGGVRETLAGGVDGYVSLFDERGQLLAGTFLGTAADDQVFFIDVDTTGQVYALGATYGQYPVEGSVISSPNSGQFLHQLSPMLSNTGWSTAIGAGTGAPDFSPTAFLVNECGNIYVAGWFGSLNDDFGASSVNLPLSSDAYRRSTDFNDFYLMVLHRQATGLLYGSFFGEMNTTRGLGWDHVDGGTSRFDKRGIVYQSVCASCGGSNGFPTTANAWSRQNRAQRCNNAAFKFDFAGIEAALTTTPGPGGAGRVVGCAPFEVDFDNLSVGGIQYIWDFDDGTQIVQNEKEGVTHVFEPGVYEVSLTVIDENTCLVRDTAVAIIEAGEGMFAAIGDQMICSGEQTQLSASGGVSYTWSPAFGLSNPNSATPVASPTETTQYQVYVRDEVGCEYTDSVTVEVVSEIRAEFTSVQTVSCFDDNVVTFENLTINGMDFLWDFGDGTTSAEENPIHTYQKDSIYTVTLSAETDGCEAVFVEQLEVEQLRIPTIFTPNGDAYNQSLEIKTTEPIDLAVFDRWGKLLYSAENYQNDWEATDLPDGVYYLMVTLPSEEFCKGVVQISRYE